MNRRYFLLASAATVTPVLSSGNASANASAGLNLGFSLYGMKSLPLHEAIETCAQIGYSHVEFALNDGYPTHPDAFTAEARKAATAQLKSHHLSLPGLMINISLTANPQDHARALRLIGTAGRMARDLEPTKPPLLETVLGGSPAMWEQQKAGMAARLAEWAAAAETVRIDLAIKAHVGSAVNSPERLLWLLDQIKSPALQVAYDYSHFELQGIDMEESLKALMPRTRFIHVKDSQGDAKQFQFLLPGTGRTDYVKYFSLLKKHRYSGPVCVEVSGQIFSKPGYDPKRAARQCHEALTAAMSKAGK